MSNCLLRASIFLPCPIPPPTDASSYISPGSTLSAAHFGYLLKVHCIEKVKKESIMNDVTNGFLRRTHSKRGV